MFRNRTAMNKHLSSAAHRRLSVMCPWCHKQEKTFTRVYDFEVHVRSHHPDIPWKGPEYFARTAGFYYALYPEDYARIAEHVVAYDSDVGYRIRKTIRAWAEGFEDKKERLEKWNQGWKDGIAVANRRARRSESRSVSKEKERDSRIVVAGGGSGTNKSRDSERKNEKTQLDKPNSRKRKGSEEETMVAEKLKKPEVGDEGLDGYTDDIELVDDDELNDALDAMVASMGNETVGSCALSDVDVGVGTVTSEVNKNVVDVGKGGDSGDVGTDAGARSNKVNKNVGDVGKGGDSGDVGIDAGARSNKVTKRVDNVGKGGDLGDVGIDACDRSSKVTRSVGDVGGTDDLGDVGNDAGDRSNIVTKSVGDVGKGGDIGDVETDAGIVNSKEARHVDDVGEAGDAGDRVDIGAVSVVVNSDADSGVNVETDIGALRNSVVMNVGVVDEACNLRDKAESDLRDKSKDRDNETDSSSSSGSSSPGSTPARTSDSLRSRAMRILSRGAMPLCPQARRVWTRNLEIEVNERKFMWPPANWRALTADSRLLAMEQMALTLERGESEDFPRISRKTLVDKYAFLMLDGQAKPTIENTEGEKVPDKIRQYHLSYLKGLIKGDIGDSRTAWSIVKTLDHSDRWLDTDEIIDMLDAGGVKIKI